MQAAYHRCPSPNVSLKGAEKPHPSRADSQRNSVHALWGDRNSGTFGALDIGRVGICQARIQPEDNVVSVRESTDFCDKGAMTSLRTDSNPLETLIDQYRRHMMDRRIQKAWRIHRDILIQDAQPGILDVGDFLWG